MSSMLVDELESARAECETAFEVVDEKIQEAEDHYMKVGDQVGEFKAGLNRFEEFLTSSEDSDSNDGIDNPWNKKYQWNCEFCPAKLDNRAILKVHTEAEHRDEWFNFLCGQCNFSAEGPKKGST